MIMEGNTLARRSATPPRAVCAPPAAFTLKR